MISTVEENDLTTWYRIAPHFEIASRHDFESEDDDLAAPEILRAPEGTKSSLS